MISFPCLWLGPPILCWKWWEYLVPDFSCEGFQLFTIDYSIDCQFLISSFFFFYVEICTLYIHFVKNFYHAWGWIYQMFFWICWDDHVVLVFYCDLSHWLICICWTILMTLGWIQFGSGVWSFCVVPFGLLTLCETFCIHIHQRYWPVIFSFWWCLCLVLVWGWRWPHRMLLFLFNLLEKFEGKYKLFFV